MRVLVCGVRGSTPAPGPEFVRYGGNTSCVAVLADSDELPRLVLDAGTGLQRLSRSLDGHPFRGSILLGHLHWDHTHGLPFFPSGDRPDSRVRVFVPSQGDPEEVLARAISPPHFPIRPSQLRGEWTFESLEPGTREVEGFSVTALEIPHKGGRTFGYRVSDGRATVAYLSDHSPIAYGPGPEGFQAGKKGIVLRAMRPAASNTGIISAPASVVRYAAPTSTPARTRSKQPTRPPCSTASSTSTAARHASKVRTGSGTKNVARLTVRGKSA